MSHRASPSHVITGGLPVCSPRPLELTAKQSVQGLMFLSDLHIGASAVDYPRIQQDLELARKHQDRIILGGDIFDLILTRDHKRFSPTALHPRLQGTDDLVNRALDWAEELLAPYASQIDLIGPGNHETAVSKHGNVDLIDLLVKRLRQHLTSKDAHGQLHHGGYAGILDYALLPTKSRYRIVHWHGAGHGGSLGTALNEFLGKLWIQNVDAFWFGHRHHRLVAQIERASPPASGSSRRAKGSQVPSLKPVWLIRSGSYFQTYNHQSQEDIAHRGRQASYAADALLLPGGRGGVRLVFTLTDSHEVTSHVVLC